MRFILLLLLLPLSCFAQGFGSFAQDQPFLAATAPSGPNDDPTNGIAGCIFWGVATNCTTVNSTNVKIWTDQSGNNNHEYVMGSGIFVLSPENYKAWILFDAVASLTNTTMGTLNQPNTAMVVASFEATTTDGGNFLDSHQTSARNLFSFNAPPGGGGNRLQLYAGTALNSAAGTASSLTNKWIIYTCQWNGANSLIRTNGALLISGNAGSQACGLGFHINDGAAFDTTQLPNVEVRELVIWNAGLNSNTLFAQEQRLARRWGITNSIVPGD